MDRLFAEWKDDCQGKKDYDADLVSLSSRYWPGGGGFHILDKNGWHGNEARPEIQPSAISTILLQDVAVATKEFKADTEDEVKALVEAWAAEQFNKIAAAIRSVYPEPPK